MTPSKQTDEVRCPRGHLTSAKFPFCTECGAELDPQGEAGVVRCANGHIVTGGHKFCIECGAPVDDVAQPAEAVGSASDIAEVEEVRCPKGHLTPAEYPYCIICGAELEKGGAAPVAAAAPKPRTPRRSVRRPRKTAPIVESPEPTQDLTEPVAEPDEEPDDATQALPEVPPAAPRRAPRTRAPRRPVRPKPEQVPQLDEDEPEGEEDEPGRVLSLEEPEPEPFLAPVASIPDVATRDEAHDHFIHSPASARPRVRPSFDRQKWAIPAAAAVLAIIAGIVLVLILRSNGTSPQVTTAPLESTAPSTPVPSAVSPNASVPMFVVSSSVGAGTSANSYVASASIRNPTDFTAKNVTVTFQLKDATGKVVATVSRAIAQIAPGKTAGVTVSGPNPGGKRPTTAAVNAVAGQLTA